MSTTTAPGPSSDGTVRWDILATGGIARLFAKDLVLQGHRVEAVGSRSVVSADSFDSAFGAARSYGSYEELVPDPGVDVVYVATSHNFHAANAMLALEAGKHVLVERRSPSMHPRPRTSWAWLPPRASW